MRRSRKPEVACTTLKELLGQLTTGATVVVVFAVLFVVVVVVEAEAQGTF